MKGEKFKTHKYAISLYYCKRNKHNILLKIQVLHRNDKGMHAALKIYVNNLGEQN